MLLQRTKKRIHPVKGPVVKITCEEVKKCLEQSKRFL